MIRRLRYIRARHCQAVWSPDVLPAKVPFPGAPSVEPGKPMGTRRAPLEARSPLLLDPMKSRCLDQPIAVSLEDFVLGNNFYRHLQVKLNLSFVREWASEHYAEPGRLSIDPAVLFNLQLVMFFERARLQELEGEDPEVFTSGVSDDVTS
jgi:hypothetical protein